MTDIKLKEYTERCAKAVSIVFTPGIKSVQESGCCSLYTRLPLLITLLSHLVMAYLVMTYKRQSTKGS